MIFAFVRLLLILLLVSALLTPLAYSTIEAALEYFGYDNWPFSRIYDRVALVVLVITVYRERKNFRLSEIRKDFELLAEQYKLSKFTYGFLLAIIPVLLAIFLLVNSGTLHWKVEVLGEYSYRLIKLVPTVLIVGLLEEIVFRLFLFWQLRKKLGTFFAAIISSCIYSFVHFIAPVKSFQYAEFNLLAGYDYYLVVIRRMLNFDLFSAVLVLLVIGLFQCLMLQKTRSLFFIAGLHGGWIAALKLAKFTTVVNTNTVDLDNLSERYYLLTLPLTWLAVAVTLMSSFLLVHYGFKRTFNRQ